VLINFKSELRVKMISRSWRDASANLLRRGIYKRVILLNAYLNKNFNSLTFGRQKTLEERVQFFAFKLRKEAKKKGKKDKLLKEDITKLLTVRLAHSDKTFQMYLPDVISKNLWHLLTFINIIFVVCLRYKYAGHATKCGKSTWRR
jgi:hypothetical protein